MNPSVLPLFDLNESPSPVELAPVADWRGMGKCDHVVQFYNEDSFLVKSVSDFIATGLIQDEPGIVIAVPAHRQGVCDHLRSQGLDVNSLQESDQLVVLDAAETLATFMVGNVPDARRFKQVIGSLLARTTKGKRPARAFGEMVAILWKKGNAHAAIKLEELWNELASDYTFSLLCGYPMDCFRSESDGQPFTQICNAHAHVIPAESYTATQNVNDRLRSISVLQQKAEILQKEIEQRKKVEKILARRERELSDFLENATEGIHQVAPTGKILWANKAELELLGYSPEEYIGRDIREFHADAPVIADILSRLQRGEKLHDYEARLKHKDGSIRFVSINSSMYTEEDQPMYTRCFTRDITERKLASEILEKTVADRTQKLREMVGELEAFSYSVSHDMRSPLRAMQGYAKALLEDYSTVLPASGIEGLERIERSARRLDLLIRDILAYSKIAKGHTALSPVALEPLLNDIVLQHPEINRWRDQIIIEHPLPTVLGHDAYLSQCLTNLIENGLKFIAPGATPRIRIACEPAGDRLRISVTDNGIGIAPEHHDRIFQIFGRVYPEKRYPGTGIGLAIVKKAVARMGGETGFESHPGQGSKFWFTLRPASLNGK